MNDNLFDPEQFGKQEGMRRADEHADVDWKDEFDNALWWAATTQPEFTSAYVLTLMPDWVTTHELRAVGPRMRAAAKHGWITGTGRTTQTGSHKRPQAIWKSNLYRPA